MKKMLYIELLNYMYYIVCYNQDQNQTWLRNLEYTVNSELDENRNPLDFI